MTRTKLSPREKNNVAQVLSGSWFKEACEMADKFDTTIETPRVCKRQTWRENHPSDSTEDYYRTSVAVPFLDYLVIQMNERFKNSKLAQHALQLIPANLVCLAGPFLDLPDGVKHLADLWDADLPMRQSLSAEFHRRSVKWERHNQTELPVPATIEDTLKLCDSELYPNIHMLLRLICVLPITTCECERTISGLRALKTYLRTSMGAPRLNGLALMKIHRDVPVDVQGAVDSYAIRYRTHMQLLPNNFL